VVPTPQPTAEPYAIVTAELSMVLSGLNSPEEFGEVEENIFMKTIVAITPHFARVNTITSTFANYTTDSNSQGGGRRGRRLIGRIEEKQEEVNMLGYHGEDGDSLKAEPLQYGSHRELATKSVLITFTISVDIRDATVNSGVNYMISSSAADDEWATSDENMASAVHKH
jgi:hypothetical protein